jgi:formylglycine-generating enzyme
MGRIPVTQAAYERIIASNPSDPNRGDFPVEKVTWDEAVKYCRAVSGRLPTEAEWEYAARAGNASSRYGQIDDIAWYATNSNGESHAPAMKAPNEWGLYDMLGNVRQWTTDWYGESYDQVRAHGSQGTSIWCDACASRWILERRS